MSFRRGFALLEIVAATVVVAALVGVSLQLFTASASQQRAAAQRQAAVQEAANLMERLVARNWDALTPDGVRPMQLSAEALQMIPDAKLTIEIVPTPGEPAAKKIAVVIDLQDRPDVPTRPVRLVAWKYRTP